MIDKLRRAATDRKIRGQALLAGGATALVLGARAPAAALIAAGVADLELRWRQRHPRFNGGLSERWQIALTTYEGTHKHPVNRALHVVGIPMIAGGAVGLFAARPTGPLAPVWWTSAGAFSTGWAMNLVGHAVFERNQPALAEDPLAFIAGPVWDTRLVARKLAGAGRKALRRAEPQLP